MTHEIIIGCEVHVQLSTMSKAFCRCPNLFGGEPNSRICPVCMGLPGSLPVVNRELIERAVVAGLALGCTIAPVTKFDRKNYVYPDLPKGYQISQFDLPICTGGSIDVSADDDTIRTVRIRRLHMEEDAGKNIHSEDGRNESLVDFNRCGTPLLEIVSEPDIRSPDEAVHFVQRVREIMRYLGVSDCNMEEASLRCDANINLRVDEGGTTFATPIAEIKNMNSFRSIRAALAFEVKRQLGEWRELRITIEQGGKTTRGFDEARGVTVLQRSKEEAADYRYFPEPDLRAISIDSAYIESLRSRVGELPETKRRRYVGVLELPSQVALGLTESRELSEYFEKLCARYADPRKAANWMLSEVKKYLNARDIGIEELVVSPDSLAVLLSSVDTGEISGKIAKELFVEMASTGESSEAIIERKGLRQISDSGELERVVARVIEEHPDSATDFRNGKEPALKYLMGQVMRATRGKANPALADGLLRRRLEE